MNQTDERCEGSPFNRRSLTIVAGLAVAVLINVGSAEAQSTPVTACGQVLSAPGNYHLTGNLGPCSGDGVLITADNVRLTLAGYTISGVSTLESCDQDSPQLGVNIMPPAVGVRVNGGTVTGFVDGILLYSSTSRVHAMNVTNNCVFGIAVSGTGNVVDTSVVTGSGVDGIGLGATSGVTVYANDISGNRRYGVVISNFSDANTIESNILRNNGLTTSGGGILVANSDNNVIRDNAANGNFDGIGLSLQITGTIIRGNTVNGNVNAGIAIAAGSKLSEVRGNTARGNGAVDLADGSPGCSTNIWKKNIFGTDAVVGVPDGGPGSGCIK